MSTRVFHPDTLNVAAFAKEAGELSGSWPLAALTRLAASAVAGQHALVPWRARGERRVGHGGDAQIWLHVHAQTRLALQCQRCLQPVHEDLVVERAFLFVHGEDAAAQLDAESEDDVLALTRALDLRELLEDELLLALPLVPRHDVCPQPLPVPRGDVVDDEVPHPFAALAALKPPGPLN